MPIHDWSEAPRGYFHHFHQRWAGEICDGLNGGLLPRGVFAMVEQYSGTMVHDVLALEAEAANGRDWIGGTGGIAVATEPPKTRFVSSAAEETAYAVKANQIALHRGDDTIAVIELVSPGNKSSVLAMRQFVDKSVGFLERGIHLTVVDLFPPTRRDRQGIHGAIWSQISDDSFILPPDKPLTLRRTSWPRFRPHTSSRSRLGIFCRTCRSSWTAKPTAAFRWKKRISQPGGFARTSSSSG